MFKAIVRFSIRKKLFVGLTTLFLFIGGIYAMLTKGVDYDPKKMVSDIKRPAVYLQAA